MGQFMGGLQWICAGEYSTCCYDTCVGMYDMSESERGGLLRGLRT